MTATWWAGLSLIMKILWGVTLAATLVFLIQSIATFIGVDSGGDFDTDLDVDFDGDVSMTELHPGGMNLYTFRNLINFLLGFGWTAILLNGKVSPTALLLAIAVLVGVLLVAVVMYLFKWLSTMQQSGNINLHRSAALCRGRVYLTIPGERTGAGKVQISINSAIREYDAVTDGPAIPTGTAIKVIEVLDEGTLLVEEHQSLII